MSILFEAQPKARLIAKRFLTADFEKGKSQCPKLLL